MKQLIASLRFLYVEVLKKDIDFDFYIKMKKPSPAGLRVGEILNLKVKDIDSDRMQIRIE